MIHYEEINREYQKRVGNEYSLDTDFLYTFLLKQGDETCEYIAKVVGLGYDCANDNRLMSDLSSKKEPLLVEYSERISQIAYLNISIISSLSLSDTIQFVHESIEILFQIGYNYKPVFSADKPDEPMENAVSAGSRDLPTDTPMHNPYDENDDDSLNLDDDAMSFLNELLGKF